MSESLLTLVGVHAGYGESPVLEDVALDVGPGEVVCLLGANGAGKTTALMAITGVVPLSAGDIVFQGRSLRGVPAHRRVDMGLALAPEGRQVFPRLTTHENLLLGSFNPRSRPVRRRNLDRVYHLFPQLAGRRGQLGGLLSGGEQQMLAIGRALMSDPQLLMLDEPSLGLSPKVTELVYDTVAEIARSGISILLVEQNTVLALELSERGFVLAHGRIVASGSSAALRDSPILREAFLGGSRDAETGA